MKSAPNNRVAAGSLEICMLMGRLLAAADHERYAAATQIALLVTFVYV